jgi:UDP-2,3-diacylglucosamine pyrophosphatase LpxH
VHEIIVVSDLHLGRGRNPRTGRYHRLEAFFYDDDFFHFCEYIVDDARQRQVPIKLVLNGDTFDLLRIDHEPQPGESLSMRERKYGPTHTPSNAADTMRSIIAGHPRFVAGVAGVLAAGHRVVFLPGNHDPEMQWQPVQDVVRAAILDALREREGDAAASAAAERILFEPWFHYEPGRIWIEHGNQYDPENSFEYSLRTDFTSLPDAVHRAEKDVPLGTFFQRYLYNSFGNITFIVPNSRSNLRYFRWLLINRPRMLARVARQQAPFFVQVLRRLASAVISTDELRACHQRELEGLARTSALGDRLYQIDGFKQVRGATLMARRIVSRAIKLAAYGLLAGLLSAGMWFVGFHAISQMEAGFGWKAALFLALNFLFLLVAIGFLAYYLLRPPGSPPDPGSRRAARQIANLLSVPLVTFGHTHDEVVANFDRDDGRPTWYFNTGTWIAVFTYDELLPRERVQYTFLRIRGTEGELLHWSPARREPAPVILLEEEHRFEPARPSGTPVA